MLLAPLAAVSLTVSPTDPTVLWPFRDPVLPLRERARDPVLPLRERAVDRARVLFDDDDRPRDEDERERAADEPRELELFREFDVLRPLDALFVLLVLPEPFLDVLLERPDVLRRRLVLAFACAILVFLRSFPLQPTPDSFRVLSTYPRKLTGNRR
jgi:hypothetical protein